MKILLVSSSVLPATGGSSVIVENLAKNFHTDELIVLGARGLRRPRYFRTADSPEVLYFFSELSFFGRGARFFEWFRKLRIKALEKHISQLIQSEGIDKIIGVYPNIQFCLAACRAAKANDIPFFSYFHNTYLENKAIKDAYAEEYQQEIFDQSKLIFVMSDGMKKYYEQNYSYDKFESLVHTFDHFPSTDNPKPIAQKAVYRLIAIGNFNESNLEATKRFLNAIKDDQRFEVDIFTHVPNLLLKERGLEAGTYQHKGSVDPDKIHEALQPYDMCLLTHGFDGAYGNVEYETIFPTRTIPFLLSGKPIIAHVPDFSFIYQFLVKNKCAEVISGDSNEEIFSGLEKIISDPNYQVTLIKNARKTAEQFYGPQVVSNLKEKLAACD